VAPRRARIRPAEGSKCAGMPVGLKSVVMSVTPGSLLVLHVRAPTNSPLPERDALRSCAIDPEQNHCANKLFDRAD
jgi:hypothetical protein